MTSTALTVGTEPTARLPTWGHSLAGGLLAAFTVAATLSTPSEHPVRPLDELGLLLLVLPGLIAGWASRVPGWALVLTTVPTSAFYALGYSSVFAPAATTITVLVAVLLGRRAQALSAATVLCLGTYAAGLAHDLTPASASIGPLWIVSWLLAASSAGGALRRRHQMRAIERAQALSAAQRGAEQERLRIARELHDSLTHSISVINVHASVATRLLDREPDRVPNTLEVIRSASAEAMRELRCTVGVLRGIDGNADPGDEPHDPGLARLPELIDRFRTTGLTVDWTHDGGSTLPPEVDRAAYRIVQEALTNVTRHAPGARVRLTVQHQPGELHVHVRNGRGGEPGESRTRTTPLSAGAGLIGMRERVDAIGGELRAGPEARGFAVHAVLVLPAECPEERDR